MPFTQIVDPDWWTVDFKYIPKLVRLLLVKSHEVSALGIMMKNVLTFATIAMGVFMVSAPAFAGISGDALSVPEPVSMSLLAGGIVAIAAVRRMRRK